MSLGVKKTLLATLVTVALTGFALYRSRSAARLCTNGDHLFARAPDWLHDEWCLFDEADELIECESDANALQQRCKPAPEPAEAEAALSAVELPLQQLLDQAAIFCPRVMAGPPIAGSEPTYAGGLEMTPVEELVPLPERDHGFPGMIQRVEVRCRRDGEPDSFLDRRLFAPWQRDGASRALFVCSLSHSRISDDDLDPDDRQGAQIVVPIKSPVEPGSGCGPGRWLLATVRQPLPTGGTIDATAWLDLDAVP